MLRIHKIMWSQVTKYFAPGIRKICKCSRPQLGNFSAEKLCLCFPQAKSLQQWRLFYFVVRDILLVVTRKIPRPWLVILLASKIITPPSTAKKQHADAVFLNAVDPTGLEPATPSLQMRCSTR